MAFKVGKNENVEVVATALGEAGENKTPQVAVTFMDAEGDTITAFLFCTDAAWKYTEQKLRKLGWDPEARGYAFEELNADPSPIAGNRVDIVCKSELYNGESKLKVQFINALGETGGGAEKMAPAEANAFAARLRAKLGVQGRPAANGASKNIPF